MLDFSVAPNFVLRRLYYLRNSILIKPFDSKIIVFNFALAKTTILSCFFFFFLIINLYVLVSAVNVQIFISTEKLVIATGTPTNEANPETETQPLTAEQK